MASRDGEGSTPRGRKKPPVSKRIPFLRAGEESNISPSKFTRVLQYISEEEMDELDIQDDGDDDAEDDGGGEGNHDGGDVFLFISP